MNKQSPRILRISIILLFIVIFANVFRISLTLYRYSIVEEYVSGDPDGFLYNLSEKNLRIPGANLLPGLGPQVLFSIDEDDISPDEVALAVQSFSPFEIISLEGN